MLGFIARFVELCFDSLVQAPARSLMHCCRIPLTNCFVRSLFVELFAPTVETLLLSP